MKKKILGLGLILILSVMTLMIVGCGNDDEESSDDSNSIDTSIMIDELNDMISNMREEGLNTYNVTTVQDYMEANTNYRLYAISGDEFNEIPEDSSSIEELGVFPTSYVMIYNTNDENYYSISMSNKVEITDEETGAYTTLPEFKEAKIMK